jgi:serine/threonine protein kinase
MYDQVRERYVVIDFGLGRFQRILGVRHRDFIGTPFYAPQEQHFGQTYVTSDVYSAAVSILEAATGVNPLRESADPAVLAQGVVGIISQSELTATQDVDLSRAPQSWRPILRGMLDRDPKSRFTAIQARDEWQKCLGVSRSLETLEPPSQQLEKPNDTFQSGKIEFESWREAERIIATKIELNGLSDFTLDVNTRMKMVVNFRVRNDDGKLSLVCPTTARRGKMSRLGWMFNPRTELHSHTVAAGETPENVAQLISAALQIGFEIKLAEVGILI